jgi:hypothetical protein
MLVRSVWLGVIETKRPELCPRFFETDLAPCILKFLYRVDGECYCGELMKSADWILHTVHLWFASALPLLLALKTISFVARTKDNAKIYTKFKYSNHFSSAFSLATYYYDDTSTLVTELVRYYRHSSIQLVLGACVAVFLFCLHSLRVLCPERFMTFIKGELLHRQIDCCSNRWRVLIAWQADGSTFISSLS